MGRRAQAIKADWRGRIRATKMGRRRGKQGTRADFTRYLGRVHVQRDYAQIKMLKFTVVTEMQGRIETAIRGAKKRWERTVSILKCYRWTIILSLYNKGAQHDPANYRTVCLLSHVTKAIDAAIFRKLNDQYIPVMPQFGFQGGNGVTQALLQGEDNARKGLQHDAVLYL